MVSTTRLKGAFETGVVHGAHDSEEDWQGLRFLDRDAEPVVGPVYDLDLVVGPELTQRVGGPRLDLEVFGHRVVLNNAEKTGRCVQPHQTTSMENS